PTDTDINAVQQGLAAYIANGHADADRKAFRFALSQSVTLHTSISGSKLAIDLVPASYGATPPDLPPPPPPPPKAVDVSKLAPLAIRAGAYATFTRLVFDWPDNVAYAVFPGTGKLTIRFEALARPDFAALAHVAPPWVKQAGWRAEGHATIIDFDTDAASGYHDFRDGNHIVLDILAPKTDADAYNPPSKGGAKPKPTKFANAKPGVANSPQAQAIAATVAALKGPAPDTDAAKPAPAPTDAKPKTDQATAPPKALPGVAQPQTTATAAAPAQPDATAAKSAAAQTPAPTPVQAADAHAARNGATLMLANAANKSVAVFVRGATAWIVLDASQPFDPVKLKTQLGDFADTLDASSSAGASVLRIGLKHDEQIGAAAVGADLKITIAPHVAAQPMAIAFARNDDEPSSANLTTLLPGANHVLMLADPVAGDTLTVIPALSGRGTIETRSFIEFAELPSASGLVLTAFSDDLAVRAVDSRVAIARPGGLKLTPPVAVAASSPAALVNDGEGPSFLDLAAWRKADGGFIATARKLQANIAKLKPDEANAARLTLARFYLGNEYAAEALGLIDLIQQSDP
ncbi:MAG TPA: hypothetical protein VH000_03950, partial [Rhizomicrobium sp.]|nr:hypothetical protein [Rhizomicrobium sp.]